MKGELALKRAMETGVLIQRAADNRSPDNGAMVAWLWYCEYHHLPIINVLLHESTAVVSVNMRHTARPFAFSDTAVQTLRATFGLMCETDTHKRRKRPFARITSGKVWLEGARKDKLATGLAIIVRTLYVDELHIEPPAREVTL